MTFEKNTQNIGEKALELDIEDLILICKNKGFSEQETKEFIENSTKTLIETDYRT